MGGGGDQGGCEPKIEVCVKIQKKGKIHLSIFFYFFFFWGGGGRVGWIVGSGGLGQGGCERRIEVFVKIQKINRGGGGQVEVGG